MLRASMAIALVLSLSAAAGAQGRGSGATQAPPAGRMQTIEERTAGLQKLDRAQEEASLDLGANYWQTFWRVTLPNLRLPIIGAALLIFTLSMDEIAVSFFLIGRDNTLPLEIWSRLRRGMTPEINAISTLIFVFSLLGIVLWYRLRARGEGQPELGAELVETAAAGN